MVAHQVECVASPHTGEQLEPTVLGSSSRLFTQDRKLNYFIQAIADEEMKEIISDHLKRLLKEDRYAASFWFMPIDGDFYHKGLT